MTRRASPQFARLAFAAGATSLLVAAYGLTGRAPDVFLMRGLGPVSIALIGAAELTFLGAVWLARRHAARGKALALACVVASLVALGIMLRHPLVGAFEFPHRDGEIEATRIALAGTAALFAILCCPRGMRWGPLIGNLTLSVVAVAVTLAVLEIAVRLMTHAPLLSFDNLLIPRTDLLTTSSLNRYDARLGWVLDDDRSTGPDGSFITGEQGVRMNGRVAAPVPRQAVLAVGDSFTAGSGVNNWETWPAQLETMLGAPVVNAATGGWGADQIVLRAETLISSLEPRLIIVSFLADDILRASYSTYSSGNKPYFTVEDGKLVAHNNPVPRYEGRPNEVGWLRRWLGRSHLAVYVLRATGGYERWSGSVYAQVTTNVADISCLLLHRLKTEADAKKTPLAFIIQYDGDSIVALATEPLYAQRVLACAQRAGIAVVDTWQPLREIHQRDPAALKTLYNMDERPGAYGHMNAAGNALIARLLVDVVRKGDAR